jgi:hypothetical protein
MSAPSASQADPDVCPSLVHRALQFIGTLCNDQDRNTACYGHQLVQARVVEGQPPDIFATEGDIASLNLLKAISTAPYDGTKLIWGASLLSMQASIPNALPGQMLKLLLLGGAEIETAVEPNQLFVAAQSPPEIRTAWPALLRAQPAADAPVVRPLATDTALLADARTSDGRYVRVLVDGVFGWLDSAAVSAASPSLENLPQYTPGESFTPMQSFVLRTTPGELSCVQAPSALLVQGPHHLRVDIRVNGADINLGSTLLLRTYTPAEAAEAGLETRAADGAAGVFEISVFDGSAFVRNPDGSAMTIPAGQSSTICLDNASADNPRITDACGSWSEPAPIRQELRDSLMLAQDMALLYPLNVISAPDLVLGTPANAQRVGATLFPTATPVPPPQFVQSPGDSSGAGAAPPSGDSGTQERYVTLCHKGRNTLTLPESAASAHLREHEDDYLGPCRGGGDDEDD